MGVLRDAEQSSMERVRMESAWAQHLMNYSQRNYQFNQENQRRQEVHQRDMDMKDYAMGKLKENEDILLRIQEATLHEMELGNEAMAFKNKEMAHLAGQREVAARELHRMLGQNVSFKPLEGLKGGADMPLVGPILDRLSSVEVHGKMDAAYQAKKLGLSPEQVEFLRMEAEVDPMTAMQHLYQLQLSEAEATAGSYEMGLQFLEMNSGIFGEGQMQAIAESFSLMHSEDPKAAQKFLREELTKARSDFNKAGGFSRQTASRFLSGPEQEGLARPNLTEADREEKRELYKEGKRRHDAAKTLADYNYKVFEAAQNHLRDPNKSHHVGAAMWENSSPLKELQPDGAAAMFLENDDVGVMQPLSYRTSDGNLMTMWVRSSQHLRPEEVGYIVNSHSQERQNLMANGGDPALAHQGMSLTGTTTFKSREGDGNVMENGSHFQVVDAVMWGSGESPAGPAMRALPNSLSTSVMPVGKMYAAATGGGKLGVTGVDIQNGVDNMLDMVSETYSYEDAFSDLMDGIIDEQVIEESIGDDQGGRQEVAQSAAERVLHTSTERMGILQDSAGTLRPMAQALHNLPFFTDLPMDGENPVMAERQLLIDEVFQDFMEDNLIAEEGLFDATYEMMENGVPTDALAGMANDYIAGIMMAGAYGAWDGFQGEDRSELIEDGYATMMRARDNLAQDEATTRLLDNYRAKAWQTVTLPAMRKHMAAKEPRISDFDMESKDGREMYKEAHSRWSGAMGKLRSMGEMLPGGGYVAPQAMGAEYLQIGENAQEMMGTILKQAQGLAVGQGRSMTAGGILAADNEVEAAKIHKWLSNVRSLMVGSGDEELFQAMAKGVGGTEAGDEVVNHLRSLASENILPDDYENMEVLVPYGSGYAGIPMSLVQDYWAALDKDNGGRTVEPAAGRVSKAMAGIYEASDLHRISLKGMDSEDIMQVDDALTVSASVLGVSGEDVGPALKARMSDFFPYKNPRVKTPFYDYEPKWPSKMSGRGESALMGLAEMLPTQNLYGYDRFGDMGLVLALYKSGLGPMAKEAASDSLMQEQRTLFQALESAEAKARQFIEDKDPTGSRGARWRQGIMAQYLNGAAVNSHQFGQLVKSGKLPIYEMKEYGLQEFKAPGFGDKQYIQKTHQDNLLKFLIMLDNEVLGPEGPSTRMNLGALRRQRRRDELPLIFNQD